MNDIVSITPLLTILVSIIATGLIIWTGERNPNLREFWSVGAGIVKFGLVVSMLPPVLDGRTLRYTLFTLVPGIEIAFKADAFSMLFAMGAAFLWIVTTFYSIGYMRSLNEHAQTRYFACFAVSLSTTMGVAFSANLFTMFLFYEGLTIITYPLVYHKEDEVSRAGARKYVIYLLGAAKVFLIAAIVLTYNLAGTLDFRKGGIFSPEVVGAHPVLLSAIFLMYLYGFAKCAVMPVHGWLPAAMVAPTPVSALLHAVAVVKTGVFTVLSVVFFVFSPVTLGTLG
ncbi:MAG TPA: proton-conducting transporter membrane subunit, partial [Dissulfurispiraceae bacterium]|nr:proton-conducting transporter membrane subunit [Dissulfurispiraceae bacterium]